MQIFPYLLGSSHNMGDIRITCLTQRSGHTNIDGINLFQHRKVTRTMQELCIKKRLYCTTRDILNIAFTTISLINFLLVSVDPDDLESCFCKDFREWQSNITEADNSNPQ